MVTAQNKELPCESELQQVESTAMQDLSRAAATALCSGISVSSPADAAAADLHQNQTGDMSARAESHQRTNRKGVGWLPAEDPGGPCSGRRGKGRQWRSEDAAGKGCGADRRPHGYGGGGGGAG